MTFKEKLLDKSESLFFRYGIRSVAMDDLARELGVSKKTLYQAVANKEELVREIFARRSAEEAAYVAQLRSDADNAIDEDLRTA